MFGKLKKIISNVMECSETDLIFLDILEHLRLFPNIPEQSGMLYGALEYANVLDCFTDFWRAKLPILISSKAHPSYDTETCIDGG